jgi:hypothetical protein
METNHKTRNVVIIVLVISVILIAILVLSFFLFFRHQASNVNEVVKSSVVTMNYKTESNEFSLTSLTPVSNDAGKELRTDGSYFDFSVTAEVDKGTKAQYEIALVKDKSSTIPDSDVVVYLERESSGSYGKVEEPTVFTPIKKKTELGSPAQSMILDQVSLSSDRTVNYRLRLWVREGAIITNPNATYTVKVKVYGKAE